MAKRSIPDFPGDSQSRLTSAAAGGMKRRRKFSPSVYAQILDRQGGLCGCGCGEALGDDPRGIEFDHLIELWNGGADSPDNLRALKPKHHATKTVREAKARAKVKRIAARDGLRKPRLTQRDKALERIQATHQEMRIGA